MADHLEILRQFNAWRRDQIDLYPFTPTEIGQAIDAAIAECEDRRRTERNRDMWKGQCDRQAAKLEQLTQLVTGDFETKEAFIARVRAVLSGEAA
ncbi:hypothetical protein JQR85_13630 [Stutzerimonas urumqiensis]|uniref:hypothetical protein n=1 Tax=Stutzerimonas urumqiensis TaxID=638269 RepID=UPI003DA2C489